VKNHWLDRKEPKFDCKLSDKEILTVWLNYSEQEAEEMIERLKLKPLEPKLKLLHERLG
jgi:hypothetical protein